MEEPAQYHIVLGGYDSDSGSDESADRFLPPESDDEEPLSQTAYALHPAPSRDIYTFVPSVWPILEEPVIIEPEPVDTLFPL
jgi:hypothetical protein